ncbi:MAG: NADH-quinone oxidoreductase subunit M [Alphaproteobacteria bacterium]|nr:NADH-quinone oxidoreductase subunit M [Alphaproteobacteria bacterium]
MFGQLPILLTTIIFLPLIGVIFILLVPKQIPRFEHNIKNVALWTSVTTFVLSLFLWGGFDVAHKGFQFYHVVDWLPSLGIKYAVGIDGISLFFVLLSTFLIPVCIIASWRTIKTYIREYMICFLLLEIMMVGMFAALDLVLFYLFFEAVLIPMFIIIGVWGGQRRVYAAFKFFLYTLLGSVLMLLAIIAIYVQMGTTSIPELLTKSFPYDLQIYLWLAFFASFAVKVPMWPVHTWLPDAHVEAPTAGSVILAGVLLKMGAYGFLRFSLPLFPYATEVFTPFVYTLSIIAIIYTSLVALAQEDMKKLIAYSSVAHMGFVTLGIFTLTQQGVQGAIFQMLSHGIVSAALFLCVGVVYDRMHSRQISYYGGLVERMPLYAIAFMIFTLASIGLPGTSGFVGEFLVLLGSFQVNNLVALFATTGLILGATYALYLYRRVIFGPLQQDHLKSILDLSPREIGIFVPLILIVFWMGIYPKNFTHMVDPTVSELIKNFHKSKEHFPTKSVAEVLGLKTPDQTNLAFDNTKHTIDFQNDYYPEYEAKSRKAKNRNGMYFGYMNAGQFINSDRLDDEFVHNVDSKEKVSIR